jgi:hypothetical protein
MIKAALATKCLWILPVVAVQIGCSGAEDADAPPDHEANGTESRPVAELAGGDVAPADVELDSEAVEPQAQIASEAESSEPGDPSDAADDELGTLGQALAPICAVPTVTSGGGITVNNFCGFDVRIKVIWGFAPDSECIHLFVDDSHHFNKPLGARFDGLDNC